MEAELRDVVEEVGDYPFFHISKIIWICADTSVSRRMP